VPVVEVVVAKQRELSISARMTVPPSCQIYPSVAVIMIITLTMKMVCGALCVVVVMVVVDMTQRVLFLAPPATHIDVKLSHHAQVRCFNLPWGEGRGGGLSKLFMYYKKERPHIIIKIV